MSVEQKNSEKKTTFLVGLTGLPTLLAPYADISPGNKDALTTDSPQRGRSPFLPYIYTSGAKAAKDSHTGN